MLVEGDRDQLERNETIEYHQSSQLDRSTFARLYRQRTKVSLREWQINVVHARLQARHLVAVWPCGSRKTAFFVVRIVVLDELAKMKGTGGTGRISVIVCPRDAIEEQVVNCFCPEPSVG